MRLYNDVLTELYDSSFELMAPIQFKKYVVPQRVMRWKTTREVEDLLHKISNILDPGSKDGNAINVVRFSKPQLSQMTAGDRAKAERSHSLLEGLITQTSRKLAQLKENRSKLFDKEHNVQQWRANELRFVDSKLKSAEEWLKRLQQTSTTILTNVNLLKRKVATETDAASEAKRKRRSQKKNEKKTAKEREARLANIKEEVVNILTGGKESLEQLQTRSLKIKRSDIDANCQLRPRLHLAALKFLLENNYLAEDAISMAESLLKDLQEQKQKAAKMYLQRKQSRQNKEKQTTMLSFFSKPSTSGSTGSSASTCTPTSPTPSHAATVHIDSGSSSSDDE